MTDQQLQDFLSRQPECRARLAALGLFQGRASVGILGAISNHPEAPWPLRQVGKPDWLRTLTQAAEAGLLQAEADGFFRIPDALAGALQTMLAGTINTDLSALERVFVAVYADWAQSGSALGPKPDSGGKSLFRTDGANAQHALRLAQRHERWEDAAHLLMALNGAPDSSLSAGEWTGVLDGFESAAKGCPAHTVTFLRETLWRLRAEWSRKSGDATGESAACRNLLRLLDDRGDLSGTARVLERIGALAAARGAGPAAEAAWRRSLYLHARLEDKPPQCELLHQLAQLARQAGDYTRAAVWLDQGMAVATKLGDPGIQARLWRMSGEVSRQRNEPERAERHFHRALVLLEGLGDDAGQAEVWEALGTLALERGAFADAESLLRRLREWFRTLHQEGREAEVLDHLAHAAAKQQKLSDAETYYQESLQARVRLRDERGQAASLCGLGATALQQKQLAQAEQWFEQSLVLAERTGDEPLQRRLLQNLGNAAFARKEFARAEQYYGLSLKLAERRNLEEEQAWLLHSQGLAAEQQRDLERAAERYRASLALGTHLGHDPTRVKALQQLGEVLFMLDRLDEAEPLLREAIGLRAREGQRLEQAKGLYRLGRIAAARRRFDEAEQHYLECLSLREAANDLPGALNVLEQLAALPAVSREDVLRHHREALARVEEAGDEHARCVLLHKLGDWAAQQAQWSEAEADWRRCLAREREGGRKSDQSLLLVKLCLAAAEQGRAAESEKFYREAAGLGVIRSADRWLPSSWLIRLGQLAMEHAQAEDALLWFQHGLKMAKDPAQRAEAMLGLGRLAFEQDDAQAESWLGQSLEAARGAGAEQQEGRALALLGVLEVRRRQFETAEGTFQQALRLLERTHDRVNVADVHFRLGGLSEEQGRARKAIQHYQEAAQWFGAAGLTARADAARSALDRTQKALAAWEARALGI